MGKDASPAIRHAVWVLGLSLLAGGMGAWLGWQAFAGVGAMLGFLTFWLTTKLVLLVAFVDRFVSQVLRSSVRVRPSQNKVSDTARGHVDDFCALGFVVGETLVVVDDEDRVLGGPYAMLSHSTEPMAAWVGPVNITIGTEIPDARLLLTTNLPHAPDDRLMVQVFAGEAAGALLQHHKEALSRLGPAGADITLRRREPQHMLLNDEECERTYLGGLSRLDRVRAVLQPHRMGPSDVGV